MFPRPVISAATRTAERDAGQDAEASIAHLFDDDSARPAGRRRRRLEGGDQTRRSSPALTARGHPVASLWDIQPSFALLESKTKLY